MKNQTINPPIGGYFKHEDSIYKAVAYDGYGCNNCCFNNPGDFLTGPCSSPINVNCNGKLIKDVTGSEELNNVELIDTPMEKRSIIPVILFLVAFLTIVIILICK